MLKEGEKIKDNKYLILILINIIFGFIILFLLYSNINFNKQEDSATQQLSQQSGLEDSNINILGKNVITNGDFEQGGLGWNNDYALREEANGNHYIINNYSWLIRQDMNTLPGTAYKVQVLTKKGSAAGPARIAFLFFDGDGTKLPEYYNIEYMHQSNDWEEINKIISIPSNASKTRIYLLTNDENSFHCFDNIRITHVVNE